MAGERVVHPPVPRHNLVMVPTGVGARLHMRPREHTDPHLHEYEYHPSPRDPGVVEHRHDNDQSLRPLAGPRDCGKLALKRCLSAVIHMGGWATRVGRYCETTSWALRLQSMALPAPAVVGDRTRILWSARLAPIESAPSTPTHRLLRGRHCAQTVGGRCPRCRKRSRQWDPLRLQPWSCGATGGDRSPRLDLGPSLAADVLRISAGGRQPTAGGPPPRTTATTATDFRAPGTDQRTTPTAATNATDFRRPGTDQLRCCESVSRCKQERNSLCWV